MTRILTAITAVLLLLASSANGNETITGVWDFSGFKDRITERLHITEENKVIRERLAVSEKEEQKLVIITSEGTWKINPTKSNRTTYLIEFDDEEVFTASFRSAAYPKDLVTSRHCTGGHRYQKNKNPSDLKDLLSDWKVKQGVAFKSNHKKTH
jgi:ABC-type glycerol-3-phosphate transport system substrate-binding protein